LVLNNPKVNIKEQGLILSPLATTYHQLYAHALSSHAGLDPVSREAISNGYPKILILMGMATEW